MALPDRFAASLAMHKVRFVQLVKLRVGGQHFGQMFRHILLVGFHTQTAPAESLIDFVQQSCVFANSRQRDFSVAFFHTQEYLLALASSFVPSM